MSNNNNYYRIVLSYEIPYNILDSNDPDILKAKENLFGKIESIIPERYEKFYIKLLLHQLKDTMNYILTYEAFFRSTDGMPMEEYTGARDLKDEINREFQEFFESVDCEYKQLNIKVLL